MKTFILFWNPTISNWKLEDCKKAIDENNIYSFNWAVWEHEKAHDKDRFFMVRCGEGKTGICMSGHFDSEPYKDEDWSGKGREVFYCDLNIDVYIYPEVCPLLSTDTLKELIPEFDWTGGHSGRELAPELSAKLEELWADYLEKNEDMFHQYAYKEREYDEEDDDYDDEENTYVEEISIEDDGKILIEVWGEDDVATIKAYTLAEAKETLAKRLADEGIDPKSIDIRFYDVNDMEELYEKALEISSSAHKGQTDKMGQPYFGHVGRVADKCNSSAAKIVALLHDTIEDTNVTAEYLKAEGFPEYIVKSVLSVTRKSNESYEDFIKRASKNKLGREVKIADLEDNMDIRRLKELTDEDILRLKKYLNAWNCLKNNE